MRRPAALTPAPRALALILVLLAGALGLSPAIASPAPAPKAPKSPAPAPKAPALNPGSITPPPIGGDGEGPSGRFALDARWLFRFDRGLGTRQHFERQRATAGWTAVRVPNAWNGADQSAAGFAGTVGWYRRDFRLPSSDRGLSWIVRFESVNYRATVWLNGHRVGDHVGTFLPFEFPLPGADLTRGGNNHLVVRVDSHHGNSTLPPLTISSKGTATVGWWNYGGLLREVYLRRVERVDFTAVAVRPVLPCPTCAARVLYSAQVTNRSSTRQTVRVSSRYGTHSVSLGAKTIAAGHSATFTARLSIAHPSLWAPGHPYLYAVSLEASAGGGRGSAPAAHYALQSGIRSVQVIGGHVYLNGRPLHLRGVGLQEDSPDNGFALSDTQRAALINAAHDLGANLIRSQYPLSPYEERLADREGLLLWSEIPVFSVREDVLATSAFRSFAYQQLAQNIAANGNHPSILVWSIANELSSRPGPGQRAYIGSAVALAHQLDPTRPVALAVAGYPSVTCQPVYRQLGVIGINDYFGWYPGPSGQIADRSLLSGYLDQARACYRRQGLFVTEFGAEANRDGPPLERGTYPFQRDFIQYHLGVFASKAYLSAAVYWALEDFRVRPGWSGGNPRPDPPVFHKGLLDFKGVPKPSYDLVRTLFHATRQVG